MTFVSKRSFKNFLILVGKNYIQSFVFMIQASFQIFYIYGKSGIKDECKQCILCNIFIIIPSSHQHILLICRIGLLSIQQFQILPACPHIYHVGLSRQYLFKYIRVSDPSELTYFSTSNMEMLVPPQTRQDLCIITWVFRSQMFQSSC